MRDVAATRARHMGRVAYVGLKVCRNLALYGSKRKRDYPRLIVLPRRNRRSYSGRRAEGHCCHRGSQR